MPFFCENTNILNNFQCEIGLSIRCFGFIRKRRFCIIVFIGQFQTNEELTTLLRFQFLDSYGFSFKRTGAFLVLFGNNVGRTDC